VKPIIIEGTGPLLLNTPVGSLRVLIEWGAKCTSCHGWIAAGEAALFKWRGPQARQPSRLHTIGAGTVELVHETCA